MYRLQPNISLCLADIDFFFFFTSVVLSRRLTQTYLRRRLFRGCFKKTAGAHLQYIHTHAQHTHTHKKTTYCTNRFNVRWSTKNLWYGRKMKKYFLKKRSVGAAGSRGFLEATFPSFFLVTFSQVFHSRAVTSLAAWNSRSK